MNPIEINLPIEIRRRLETQARLQGKTINELTRELVESALRTCADSEPKTSKEVLHSMGRLGSLSENLRNKIIPGVTLDEVRAAISKGNDRSLSDIIDEQRGRKA
jgi:hypothetical protein